MALWLIIVRFENGTKKNLVMDQSQLKNQKLELVGARFEIKTKRILRFIIQCFRPPDGASCGSVARCLDTDSTQLTRYRQSLKVQCSKYTVVHSTLHNVHCALQLKLKVLKVFTHQEQVLCTFLEQMLRSVYSTVHAIGLLLASTIPRDGNGWYKPQSMYCRILNLDYLLQEKLNLAQKIQLLK